MSVDNSRLGILKRFREQIARGEPIIGGGAGTGLSAVSEEAGGIDLLIVYNSGRYRMAGRGSSAGLLAYGNANQIVKEMAYEVLPVVKKTPVLAGRQRDRSVHHPQAVPRGAADARLRRHPELPDGRSLRRRHAPGLRGNRHELSARSRHHPARPRAGSVDDALRLQSVEAERMADAGADLIVAHMGVTTGGSIGAKSSKTLDDCVDADPADLRRRARREPGGPGHLPRRADLGAARRGIHHHEVPRRGRLLRRQLGGAPAGRARHRRTDQDVQEDSPVEARVVAVPAKPAAAGKRRRPMTQRDETDEAIEALRFVTAAKARVEFAPWGKHWWLSQPGLTDTKQLTLVRVQDAPRRRPPVPLPSRPRGDHLHRRRRGRAVGGP